MRWKSSGGLRPPSNSAERWFAALTGGLIHGLAFKLVLRPDYYLWVLAPVMGVLGLAALLWSLRGATPRGGAGQGFFAWALAGAAGLYWMSEASWGGYALLTAYTALLGLLFGLLAAALRRGAGSRSWVPLVAALWAVMELVRAYLLTGFPWMTTASLFAGIPWVCDPADIGGAYMVSFLVALLVGLLVGRKPGRAWLRLLLTVLLVGCWLGYGAARPLIFGDGGDAALRLRVAAVQARVPFKVGPKADPEKQLADQLELMKQVKPGETDLVIWSETMVPGDLIEKVQSLLAPMAREKKCWLLAGGVVHLKPPAGKDMTASRNYNSAVLISPRGEVVGRYDKRHLVPFGEYVPLGGELPGSEYIFKFITVFTPGDLDQALPEVNGIPVAINICYEDVFPHIVRGDAARGARLLVNLTNDSWFRESDQARQHLALAALRAVETRRPLIRATNSGVSALITPDGNVTVPEGGGLWKKGLVRMDLRLTDPTRAPYVLVGDIFAYGCAAAVLLGLLATLLPRRSAPPPLSRPVPPEPAPDDQAGDNLPGGAEMLEDPPERPPDDEPIELGEPEAEPEAKPEPETEPEAEAAPVPEPPQPSPDGADGARRARSSMEDTHYMPTEGDQPTEAEEDAPSQ